MPKRSRSKSRARSRSRSRTRKRGRRTRVTQRKSDPEAYVTEFNRLNNAFQNDVDFATDEYDRVRNVLAAAKTEYGLRNQEFADAIRETISARSRFRELKQRYPNMSGQMMRISNILVNSRVERANAARRIMGRALRRLQLAKRAHAVSVQELDTVHNRAYKSIGSRYPRVGDLSRLRRWEQFTLFPPLFVGDREHKPKTP